METKMTKEMKGRDLALADLKALTTAIPPIKKQAQGYGYKYASLDSIQNILREVDEFKKFHIMHFSDPVVMSELVEKSTKTTDRNSGNIIEKALIAQEVSVTTVLTHIPTGIEFKSTIQGYVEKESTSLPQGRGSAITFFRRYNIVMLLDLCIEDEDNDAELRQTPASSTKSPTAKKPSVRQGSISAKFQKPTLSNKEIF